MNMTPKQFFVILFLLIAHYQHIVSNPGYASDSLKVGIIFKETNQVDLDSISEQLIQAFDQNSKLNLVSVDANLIVSIEPLALDSVALDSLKQHSLNGLIVGYCRINDSGESLVFIAKKNHAVIPIQIGEIELSQQNFQDSLRKIVGKLFDYFQPVTESPGRFKVAFTPIKVPENDSSSIAFHKVLIDTLKAIFSSPQFSNIRFEFLENDTLNRSDKKSVVEMDGSSSNNFPNKLDLVIAGEIDYGDAQHLAFYPHLRVEKNYKIENKQFEKNEALAGKTCSLEEFSLYPITVNNMDRFINFLSAYFSIKNEKYDEAIYELKDFDSMADYFFLAESYFNRGLTRKNDFPAARADWDSCMIYFKASLSEAESLQDSICIMSNLGVTNQLLGKIDSATVYFTIAYEKLDSTAFDEGFIRVSNNLGNILLLSAQWKKALDVFQASVEFMEKAKDSLNLAATYENLAAIYQLIMQRNKAISYYERAFEIRESMNDAAGMATVYMYLGDIYQEMKEFNRATSNYKKGLILTKQLHNEPGIAECSNRLGQVFQELNVLDSALVYYQHGYNTFEMLGDEDGLLRTTTYQASVHQKLKNFEQAISLYEKALEFAKKNGNSKNVKANIFDRLGDIYNNQQNLIIALDYYQKSADLNEQLENFETLSLILYNMGLIKLKQNDYAEGYQLLKRAISLDENHGFNNLSGEKDFLNQLEGILK